MTPELYLKVAIAIATAVVATANRCKKA